ncbi:MAG: NapC/NirT family cytochrome c [Pyrinomonadaceae bacterium]
MKETDQSEKNVDIKKPSKTPRIPGLLRNYISFIGIAIAAAGLTSFLLLLLMELSGSTENPYTDLITFIFVPSIIIFGMAVAALGALIERRRRRGMSPGDISSYPVLDLNDPSRRRSVILGLCLVFIFLFMSAFGSFRAYEYTESVTFCGEACHSVMKPEFVAYQAAPHANIRCVECHVGGGAEAYVKSKFAGMRQLYGVVTGHYNRPIQTPVHNMRSANETCQKCHWSEKFHGDVLRVFNHYGYDEQNSLDQTRLLVKVGGGDPASGPVGGIHWHMNTGNEVSFIASDEKRQVIPWVRMKDRTGAVVEFKTADFSMTAQDVERSSKRTMDCIDCHNRPTHIYLSPNEAIDRALDSGKLSTEMPFIKAKAVEALAQPYLTNDEAVAAIAARLNDYYRSSYPELFTSRPELIGAAVAETQRVYQTYFFPEMKTDWRAHPNNIGHYNAQGCFRCHDGQHFSSSGRVIRNDCNVCHTTIDQTIGGKTTPAADGVFRHPVNLGDKNTWQCASCHKGDQTFKHPLNLGDISRFQCAECHKSPDMKMN